MSAPAERIFDQGNPLTSYKTQFFKYLSRTHMSSPVLEINTSPLQTFEDAMDMLQAILEEAAEDQTPETQPGKTTDETSPKGEVVKELTYTPEDENETECPPVCTTESAMVEEEVPIPTEETDTHRSTSPGIGTEDESEQNLDYPEMGTECSPSRITAPVSTTEIPVEIKEADTHLDQVTATRPTAEVYYDNWDKIDPFTDPFGSSTQDIYPVPETIRRWRAENQAVTPKFITLTSETCWRCGGTGHQRDSCTRPSIIFCSRCGKVGTLSRRCQCVSTHARARVTSSTRTTSTRTVSRATQCCRHRDVVCTPCPTCGCPHAVNRKPFRPMI